MSAETPKGGNAMTDLLHGLKYAALALLGLLLVTIGVVGYAVQVSAATSTMIYDSASLWPRSLWNDAIVSDGGAGTGIIQWAEWSWTPTSTVSICQIDFLEIRPTSTDLIAIEPYLKLTQGSNVAYSLATIPSTETDYTRLVYGGAPSSTWFNTSFFSPCVVPVPNVAITITFLHSYVDVDPNTIEGEGTPISWITAGPDPRPSELGPYVRIQHQSNNFPTLNYSYQSMGGGMRIYGGSSHPLSGPTLDVFDADYTCPEHVTSTASYGIYQPLVSFVWDLFVPTCEDYLTTKVALGIVANKVPFGYVSKSLDAMETGFEPGHATGTIGIPIPGHATLTVFDPSTIFDGQSKALYWITFIRFWESVGLWFVFMWWLYHRGMQQFETL